MLNILSVKNSGIILPVSYGTIDNASPNYSTDKLSITKRETLDKLKSSHLFDKDQTGKHTYEFEIKKESVKTFLRQLFFPTKDEVSMNGEDLPIPKPEVALRWYSGVAAPAKVIDLLLPGSASVLELKKLGIRIT